MVEMTLIFETGMSAKNAKHAKKKVFFAVIRGLTASDRIQWQKRGSSCSIGGFASK